MARMLIFTCGTSLLNNFGSDEEDPCVAKNASVDLKNKVSSITLQDIYLVNCPWRQWNSDESRSGLLANDEFNDLPNGMIDLLSKRDANNPIQTAEVSTYSKIKIQNDDQIYLLASNTPDGLFCALINAYLLKHNEKNVILESRDWISSQNQSQEIFWAKQISQTNWSLTNNDIHLFPIIGLGPENKYDFEIKGIYNLMRTVSYLRYLADINNCELEIIFTGGYKASVPILTQTAGWLGIKKMTCLFENAHDVVTIPILENPPAIRFRKAVKAFSDSSKKIQSNYAKLNQFNNVNCVEQIAPLEYRIFFKNKENRNGIELSLFGNALLAYIEARLQNSTTSEAESQELLTKK